MSLHRQTRGAGPDLALLHGWGLNGSVFEPLATALATHFRVQTLDLPGHGRSPWSKGAADLEGLARTVAAHLPEHCSLLGWSLGGLAAVRIATLYPARVPQLVLIATGACGARRRDWPHGADEALLAGLALRLGRDWRATLQEFLGLAVRRDENSLATLRELRRCVAEHAAPGSAALAAGLAILRGADLRPELPAIRARTLVIAGEYDRLTPPAAAAALAALVPGARLEQVARTAHAPFLSRPEQVVTLIRDFLAER